MAINAVQIVGLGSIAIDKLVVKYQDEFYQKKIDKLTSLTEKLDNDKNQIDSLVKKVRTGGFFSGDQADKLYETVYKPLLADVEVAKNQAAQLKEEYINYRKEMLNRTKVISGLTDTMTEAVNKLNIK